MTPSSEGLALLAISSIACVSVREILATCRMTGLGQPEALMCGLENARSAIRKPTLPRLTA
jgi:hypothetical protein